MIDRIKPTADSSIDCSDCSATKIIRQTPTASKRPKVQMGNGAAPAQVIKHVPRVQMGNGAAPAQVIKHVPRVQMGNGVAPAQVIKHVSQRAR